MKFKIVTCFILLPLFSVLAYAQEELPDNYLLITLKAAEGKLQGTCEFLEGYILTMDLPSAFLKNGLDSTRLFSLIKKQEIKGTLTYLDGKTTEIKYEVVNHRGADDIYMKTSLGYFLWEMLKIKPDEVYFAINWWYCPPARDVDLKALKIAAKLLADSANWNKTDDRKCEDDEENNKWSLFCALKYASIKTMGEYNHHNTAMQTVRFVIDELIPGHEFEHTLMDYNNLPATKHKDILFVINEAKKRIELELKNKKERK
jgi:hypothetical protein